MPAPSRSNSLAGLSVDQRDIRRVVEALGSEADGKQLKRELAREIRKAANPVIREMRQTIQSAPSRGLPHATGGPLRQAMAKAVTPTVVLTGNNPRVGIRARKIPQVRGFDSAAKRFNARSFRHPTFGRRGAGDWQTQVGKPGWFDETAANNRDQFRDAAMAAVEAMARRIAARARR